MASASFNSFLNRGTSEKVSKNINKRIRLLNLLLAGLTLISSFVLIIDLSFAESFGLQASLVSIALFTLNLIINQSGSHLFSRSFFICHVLSLPFIESTYLSKNAGLPLYFIAIISILFLVFSYAEKKFIAIFGVLTILALGYMEFTNYNPFNIEKQINLEYEKYAYLSLEFSVISILFLAILFIVRENKLTEEKLVIAQQEAEKAAKSKSEFLSVMSHEIRTPLNGIIGITELLSKEALSSPIKKNIKVMQHSASTLLCLVNEVLDYSKIESGKIEINYNHFNVHDLITKIKNSLLYRVEKKGLTFISEIKEDTPTWIKGDGPRLNQILLNLLDNAIKFTENGFIKIKLTVTNKEENIVFLTFEVSDSGIGIPKEKIDTIFEKFTQASQSTTREFGGTGLGVSICQNLIESMGGKIKVNSKKGHGSTFSFTLPLEISNEKEIPTLKDKSSNKNTIGGIQGLKILLVEDNAINQFVTKQIFKYLNLKYSIVENGSDAIEILKRETFDLVLMDYHMPNMDGLEATKLIRGGLGGDIKNPNIPIIVISADVQPWSIEQLKNAGADDYLIKPLELNTFTEKLELFAQQYQLKPSDEPISTTMNLQPFFFDLEYIKSIVGDDEEIIFELIRMGSEKIPEQIKALKSHLENQNGNDAISILHNLKSNLRNIGIPKLGQDTESIEVILRNEEGKIPVDTLDKVEELEVNYFKAEIELEQWSTEYKNTSA